MDWQAGLPTAQRSPSGHDVHTRARLVFLTLSMAPHLLLQIIMLCISRNTQVGRKLNNPSKSYIHTGVS